MEPQVNPQEYLHAIVSQVAQVIAPDIMAISDRLNRIEANKSNNEEFYRILQMKEAGLISRDEARHLVGLPKGDITEETPAVVEAE